MTKFAKVVVVVGILALVPAVVFVRWAIWAIAPGLGGNEGDIVVPTILVTALIYVAAGVVIVAPAWVITQVLMLVLQHAIVKAFTPKDKR
jgi:hypothetical protein